MKGIVRSLSVSVFSLPLLFLSACSSPAPQPKQAKAPDAFGPGPATATGKNPLDKYLELAGFRLSESGAGKLKVRFAAINHSQADLGELAVKVRLVTSAAKQGDPPITE